VGTNRKNVKKKKKRPINKNKNSKFFKQMIFGVFFVSLKRKNSFKNQMNKRKFFFENE